MTVVPGANLALFTAARHAGFQYLGQVTYGQEIGALAVTPQGSLVRVNGSVVTPLPPRRIHAALRRCGMAWLAAELPGKTAASPAPAHGLVPASAGSSAAGPVLSSAQRSCAPSSSQGPTPAVVPIVVRRKRRIPVAP